MFTLMANRSPKFLLTKHNYFIHQISLYIYIYCIYAYTYTYICEYVFLKIDATYSNIFIKMHNQVVKFEITLAQSFPPLKQPFRKKWIIYIYIKKITGEIDVCMV